MSSEHLPDFHFALTDEKAVRIASELDAATEHERGVRWDEETRRKIQHRLTALANQQALNRLCAPRLTSLCLQASQLVVSEEFRHSHSHCVSSRFADDGVFTLIVRADDEESRDVRSVFYQAESDMGIDDFYSQPFSVVRFRLARIVLLPQKSEEYLPAARLWKSVPQADLPRVRWRPLQPGDRAIDPRLRRLLWPELDALNEKLAPNLRWWKVEITANAKSLAKLKSSSLNVAYGLNPNVLFGLPERIQHIFEVLLESFLVGCGLREASFDADREILNNARSCIPPWLRLAGDELLSRRFREMANGAGVNGLSSCHNGKIERQARHNRNWEIVKAA